MAVVKRNEQFLWELSIGNAQSLERRVRGFRFCLQSLGITGRALRQGLVDRGHVSR